MKEEDFIFYVKPGTPFELELDTYTDDEIFVAGDVKKVTVKTSIKRDRKYRHYTSILMKVVSDGENNPLELYNPDDIELTTDRGYNVVNDAKALEPSKVYTKSEDNNLTTTKEYQFYDDNVFTLDDKEWVFSMVIPHDASNLSTISVNTTVSGGYDKESLVNRGLDGGSIAAVLVPSFFMFSLIWLLIFGVWKLMLPRFRKEDYDEIKD